MATGFDITALTPFVDETSQEVIARTLMGASTNAYADVIEGIPGTTALNFLDADITFHEGTSCDTTISDTATLYQRNITVKPFSWRGKYCYDDLKPYWPGVAMKAGYPTEPDAAIGKVMLDDLTAKASKDIAKQQWVGGLGSPAYGIIDGFIKLLSTESDRIVATSGTPNIMTGPFTSLNIIEAVEIMAAAFTGDMLAHTDNYVFMSLSNFILYRTAAAKAYGAFTNFAVNPDNTFEMDILGTTVKAKGLIELNDTDYMVGTFGKNLVVAYDLLSESTNITFGYERILNGQLGEMHFSTGVQIKFPMDVVTNF